MKYFLITLALFASLPAFSQNATIEGLITHRSNQSLQFVYPEHPIRAQIHVGETRTDAEGRFSFTFDPAEGRLIEIRYDTASAYVKFYLWIGPGKSLRVVISDDSTIRYTGQSAQENSLLDELGLNRSPAPVVYDTTAFRFGELSAKLDSIYNAKLRTFQGHTSSHRYSSEFLSFLEADLFFETFRKKYYYIQEYTFSKGIPPKEFSPPSEFTRFLKSVRLYSDKAFHSLKFRNGLREYFDEICTRTKGPSENYTLHVFRTLDATLKYHPRTKEYLKAYFLKFGFAYDHDLDSLITSLGQFQAENPQSRYLAFFNDRLKEKIALVYSQKKLPDISLSDTSGKLISLKDFTGKILLIDFWGSWCQPCMAEMPFSRRIEEEIQDDRVRFIYIDTYDDEQRWKEAVRMIGVRGIHLKADRASLDWLKSFYTFTNLPFYVITDPTGKPLNPEVPIRPSTNAKAILLDLLKNMKGGM